MFTYIQLNLQHDVEIEVEYWNDEMFPVHTPKGEQ
jgi:hypothetical protein